MARWTKMMEVGKEFRFKKGQKPWNAGTKQIAIQLCKECDIEFSYHTWEKHKGREFCSKGCASANRLRGSTTPLQTRINQSLAKTKEKEFTGFKKQLCRRIRLLNEYKEWRLQVFGRDNFTCQNCRARGVYFEAHHIKPFSLILFENNIKNLEEAKMCKELWNIQNGITYCQGCHIEIDKSRGRNRGWRRSPTGN